MENFRTNFEESFRDTFAPRGKISGPIIPTFILKKTISFGAKIMYALLCNYAGKNDHCWPSHGTLASELGCSVSSVKNYLRELQAINLISVQHEGRFRSSTYYMLKPSSSGSVSEPKVDYQVAKNWLLNNLTNKNTIYPPLPPSSAKPPRAAAHVSPTKSGGGGGFSFCQQGF